MERLARARAGFTLIEIIVVMALGMIVFIGVIGLGSQMSRTTVDSRRQAGAQMDAAALMQIVDRRLREATQVSRPASGSGATLEGCSNAATLPGDSTPSALDTAKSMKWFAFCHVGETLHYHEGVGCPGTYTCGTGSTLSFGQTGSPASASFARPASPASQVDVSVTMAVKDKSTSLQSSIAFAANNQ